MDEVFHDAGGTGDDHEGVAGGDGGHDGVEDSDGEHNPYEVCYKINSRIANARMCHMSQHTCHMSQLYVPCHFDRVSLSCQLSKWQKQLPEIVRN